MRKALLILTTVFLLVLAACGDDDTSDATGDPPTTAATTAGSGDTGDTTDDMDDDGGDDMTDGGEMMGDSYADVSANGETVRFNAGEMTFSTVEGVADLTFEECDPSFFGVGFWVIGYPVDGNGEILLSDDGTNIAGILTALFPFEDTPPETMEFEFDVEHEGIGLDARYRADSGSYDYSIDGNRVTGTVTLDQFGETVDVTFDVVCAG